MDPVTLEEMHLERAFSVQGLGEVSRGLGGEDTGDGRQGLDPGRECLEHVLAHETHPCLDTGVLVLGK